MIPTATSVLSSVKQARLLELARELGARVPPSARKETQIRELVAGARLELPAILRLLVRDELRAACRDHDLDAASRSRAELAGRLLDAAGLSAAASPPPVARQAPELPARGDIVAVRHRQYLVDAVHPGAAGEMTRVALVGLDDDNGGRRVEVLWEHELGARVLSPEAQGLGDVTRLDPPRTFGAYYDALRWNRVTATDARLFQAPFRAGVKLMLHQLTPLKRALDLPRANLFIADDVGLGKTIEAGLVMQELLLRNQVDFVLIVAPAAVCPQWQREMARRFGVRFELYNRAFVQRRRQDRGYGVNPWVTHTRFIISYQTLRRADYREPLHALLGEGDRRTLLVLDEAHTAAPASSARYAIFSETTRVVQQLAPLFDHRLFLSATPHNGHSNSFSTLLSLLDRQRFTRAVSVDARALEQVMVRRLKSDLRAVGQGAGFPQREVVALQLTTRDAPELELARLLAEYTRLAAPATGRDRLVFIHLQKRLLSSVRAFARTLEAHARHLGAGATAPPSPVEDDEEDLDEDAREAAGETDAEARSRALPPPPPTARELLERMRALALRHRDAACAKTEALKGWVRAHPDRRVIVFTEYGDTRHHLLDHLGGGDEIVQIHGGMSDVQREEVQRAWNEADGPARILIATDAAREGLNLQGHCADLFHFDVPWNPARMEQRNGRIDRAMQRAPVVRCHYFVYEHRPEDHVLALLVKKVRTIHDELGSLATVVLGDLERALEGGITAETAAALGAIAPDAMRVAVVNDELEQQRDPRRLQRDLDENGAIHKASAKALDFSPELLRDAVEVGLSLAGAGPLEPAGEGTWRLPELPETWQRTLDTLRPPRNRDEDLWDWRRRPPVPVVFDPPDSITEEVAHLHLAHPVTQRILSRFLAQGFSARDLSRVTALAADVPRPVALALARLSLFGPGAARLHDELLAVAAWSDGGELTPMSDKETAAMRARFEARIAEPEARTAVAQVVGQALVASAARDLGALWRALEEEADAEDDRARKMLSARARAESAAMRALLAAQEQAIARELEVRRQVPLTFNALERSAWEADLRALGARVLEIAGEREREPARIEAQYEVALRRLVPVGMVYLWPEKKR